MRAAERTAMEKKRQNKALTLDEHRALLLKTKPKNRTWEEHVRIVYAVFGEPERRYRKSSA